MAQEYTLMVIYVVIRHGRTKDRAAAQRRAVGWDEWKHRSRLRRPPTPRKHQYQAAKLARGSRGRVGVLGVPQAPCHGRSGGVGPRRMPPALGWSESIPNPLPDTSAK